MSHDSQGKPTETNLIVGDGANRRDDELSISCDVGLVGPEVGVLVQNTGIFLAVRVDK